MIDYTLKNIEGFTVDELRKNKELEQMLEEVKMLED
jgi:hypothetical protein